MRKLSAILFIVCVTALLLVVLSMQGCAVLDHLCPNNICPHDAHNNAFCHLGGGIRCTMNYHF
jgi:hypothetical protein